jgi:prepilin-type N-terminal cleavage/methylation domain-containing protein
MDNRLKPTTREFGFTLIEVMLSAVLLGILVAFYSGIIVQSLEVRDKITGAVEHYEMYQGYLERIEKDLRAAYIDQKTNTQLGARTIVYLENNSESGQDLDRLVLTSMSNFLFDLGEDRAAFDHVEIEYQFDDEPYQDESAPAWDLYRRSDSSIDLEPLEGGYSFLFVKKIRGFNVRLFSRTTKNWEESWDTRENNNELPAAAEIVLWVGQGADPDGWRPLVKTIFLENSVGGVYEGSGQKANLDRDNPQTSDDSDGREGASDPETDTVQ